MPNSITNYDESTNTIRVEILKPFYTAGVNLDWESKVGYGFTPNVINAVIEKKAVLCCYLTEYRETSYCSWIHIKEFLLNELHMGQNNGKPIVYLPRDLFSINRPVLTSMQEKLF